MSSVAAVEPFTLLVLVLSVTACWSQASRSLRKRSVEGMSPLALAFAFMSCWSWLLYGAMEFDATQMFVNAMWIAPTSIFLMLVLSDTDQNRGKILSLIAIWALALWTAQRSGVEQVPAFIGTVVGNFAVAAQAWRCWRRPSSLGLSVGSLLFGAANGLSWVMYGLDKGNMIIVTGSAFAVAFRIISIQATTRHRRSLATNFATEPVISHQLSLAA